MRAGVSEVGVTEIVAVIEHTVATARTMKALLVMEDCDERATDRPATLVPLYSPADADARTAGIYKEIRLHEEASMGVSRVPHHWRAIGSNYAYLQATWIKHKTVMAPGEINEVDKLAVSLGASMTVGSEYLIRRLAHALRRHGYSDADVLELAAVTDHYNSFNIITDAMQVASDIVAPGGADA